MTPEGDTPYLMRSFPRSRAELVACFDRFADYWLEKHGQRLWPGIAYVPLAMERDLRCWGAAVWGRKLDKSLRAGRRPKNLLGVRVVWGKFEYFRLARTAPAATGV